jgi:hypothetical protein
MIEDNIQQKLTNYRKKLTNYNNALHIIKNIII